jgi:hypothetical protein
MTVEEMFDEVGGRLVDEHAGVEQGRILHSVGLKTAGKFFAFVARGELVVKLPAKRVDELVSGSAGRPFDAGRGRPMKEWVRLRPADEAACAAYVVEARRFVANAQPRG